MSSERRFFVASKFGAPQGVKGFVRVISFMEDPDAIFDCDNWYLPAQAYGQFAQAGDGVRCKGVDADQEYNAKLQPGSSKGTLDLISTYPLKWNDHPKGYAVSLPGLYDRNQAQLLTHQLIYLPLDTLENLEEDYYWRDLIGLQVLDADKNPQGVISEIMETGANDVLVVTGPNKSRVLVPYIPEQVIIDLDRDAKTIQLDWDFSDDDEDDEEKEEA